MNTLNGKRLAISKMFQTLPTNSFLQVIFFITFLCWAIFTFSAWGQEILTPKQPIASLVEAQTIYLRTQVLKEGIQIDSQHVAEVIAQRFQQVGYRVVFNIKSPHDVTVDFQCEEPPRFKPLADSTEKYFLKLSGPPCLFHYAYQEALVDWQRIDTIIYNEGIRAAEALHQMKSPGQSGSRAQPVSIQYLETLDFPILLSAEWGQASRLVALLESPQTPLPRRKKIISLLGEIRADQALPYLFNLLQHATLRIDAARALGNFGAQAQKPLISILKNHPDVDMQAAAAQSLGRIGAATGDTSLTPLYLDLLAKEDLDIHVKIEIVWAIGKSPDFQAHSALEALEHQIWTMHSDEPNLQKLREAVDWSIREVRQGGHTGAYY